jgi:putative intracellular protease/amidase
MKRILMVITSNRKMENTDSKTGVWLGEFTDPYYKFIDSGYQVVLASPEGGRPPIDPMSELTENITTSNRRFQKDDAAQYAFRNTKKLAEINSSEFDAIFYPGGHGPLWDLAFNESSGKLILDFYNTGKPIGAVCHGPAAFIKAEELQPGFLKGKKISVFTNTEELIAGRSKNVPYKLESRLQELGAEIYPVHPFLPNVKIDGLLITGQNPLSAGPTAKALIEVLERRPVPMK